MSYGLVHEWTRTLNLAVIKNIIYNIIHYRYYMSLSHLFITNAHRLYDHLHGETKVSSLFDNVSTLQVEELITIYQTDVLNRWTNIANYLYRNSIQGHNAACFYVNALQHFLFQQREQNTAQHK